MNIIQTKGNSIFWWSVVQFIAERCFGHKKLQMKSISNLSNYQRKSLLRASSTILRLWPCSCCALLGWIPCMPGCGIAAADDAIHGHTHRVTWPDSRPRHHASVLGGTVLHRASAALGGSLFWYSGCDVRLSEVTFTLTEPALLLSSVVSLLPWFDSLLASFFRASLQRVLTYQ